MTSVAQLRKAVLDRTQRTAKLNKEFQAQDRAGLFRLKRTRALVAAYKAAKPGKDKTATLKKFRESRTMLRKSRKERASRLAAFRRSKAKLVQWSRALARKDGGAGGKATAWLEHRVGWTEKPAGSNDAPYLANWRNALNMGWMRGQPWCGFACQAAYHYAAHKTLPTDTPSTIAIANRARSGDGYTGVGLRSIQRGDLVVFNFGSGGPKHVGLARGPMSGGVVSCVEANTSPSSSGSQANGGGIFIRSRSAGLIHTVARPR
ncbi:MAG: hypothetical protein ACR2NH_04090 [Solirubrobacteraceae bacterium]